MDKNSESNVPKEGSPKNTHRSPVAEKKTQQESRDELSQSAESDALSKLSLALPEDLDESVTSEKSDSAEAVKCIPGLAVGNPSSDSTSLLEQEKNANNLSESQQSIETHAGKIFEMLYVNLSNDFGEISRVAIEAIQNLSRILSTEQASKIPTQESGSSAADISLLPEEQKCPDALMNKEENLTNSPNASEKDPKSPFRTHFSEGRTNNLSQTDPTKFTGGNAFDFKEFSDGECPTDHIKFADSSSQTDSKEVFDIHCQTDPINSLEHENEVNVEKFTECQTYDRVYSTEDSSTLKPSESEPDEPESFLHKSDASEHSECESNMAICAACESDAAEYEKRQTHSEQFSDSEKNSELSHSGRNSLEYPQNMSNSSRPSSRTETSDASMESLEQPQSSSNSTGYPSSRTDRSDASMESLDSVADSSELSDSRTYSLGRRHRVPEYLNLPRHRWHISDLRPHLSDNDADASDSRTDTSQDSESPTDVAELSKNQN